MIVLFNILGMDIGTFAMALLALAAIIVNVWLSNKNQKAHNKEIEDERKRYDKEIEIERKRHDKEIADSYEKHCKELADNNEKKIKNLELARKHEKLIDLREACFKISESIDLLEVQEICRDINMAYSEADYRSLYLRVVKLQKDSKQMMIRYKLIIDDIGIALNVDVRNNMIKHTQQYIEVLMQLQYLLVIFTEGKTYKTDEEREAFIKFIICYDENVKIENNEILIKAGVPYEELIKYSIRSRFNIDNLRRDVLGYSTYLTEMATQTENDIYDDVRDLLDIGIKQEFDMYNDLGLDLSTIRKKIYAQDEPMNG